MLSSWCTINSFLTGCRLFFKQMICICYTTVNFLHQPLNGYLLCGSEINNTSKNFIMKNYVTVPVVMATVFMLGSCTKDPVNNLNAEESRIYITNHDSTANLASFKTFSISDSVAVISNNHLQEKTHDSFDSLLIAAFVNAMTQRGYTLVTKDQSPDLGINVSNIINTYTGYVDYGSYYNDYY